MFQSIHPAKARQEGQDLTAHLSGVSRLCSHSTIIPIDKWVSVLLPQVGLLHDFGKFKPEWQAYLRSGSGKSPGHSKEGAKYLYDRLQNNSAGLLGALLIAGHHSGLANLQLFADGIGQIEYQDALTPEAQEFLSIHASVLQPVDIPQKIKDVDDRLNLEFLIRLMFGILIDSDRRDAAGVGAAPSNLPRLTELAESLEDKYRKFPTPTEPVGRARADLADRCLEVSGQGRGFYSLRADTGSGKTLAGMRFALNHAVANGMEGVVVVPPYQAVVYQTADVYRKVFGKVFGEDAVLEHHAGVDVTNKTNEELSAWEQAGETWEEPIIVTTMVRLFELSLFSNKPTDCRRLPSICNRVIVLDEVQALPINLLMSIMKMLKRLVDIGGCTVVLQSATVPDFFRFGVNPIPISNSSTNLPPRVRYSIDRNLPDREIVDRLASFQDGLVVVNTKDEAGRMYELVRERLGDAVFYLTTNLYQKHRRERLAEIRCRLAQGELTYVIATPLIEAGVDLDFSIGFREATGIDSLVQFAGRINRNRNRESADVVMFGSRFLDENKQRGVVEACRVSGDIGSLESISKYFEVIFGGIRKDPKEDSIIKLQNKFSFEEVAKNFKMIREENSVIVLTDEARSLLDKLKSGISKYRERRKIWRQLQQYTATIPQNWKAGVDAELGVKVWELQKYNEYRGAEAP